MPEKYQGFIQSSIRKVFIDIPSISRLTKEVGSLKSQVKTLSKEKKDIVARSERQFAAYDQAEDEWRLKVEELLFDYDELRKKHESLKSKYALHMYVLVLSFDAAHGFSYSLCSDGTGFASTSGGGSGDNVDMEGISIRSEPSPAVHLRPKRALPKSRTARRSDAGPPPQIVKRPRINVSIPINHSDLDASDELLDSAPTLTSRRTQNPTSGNARRLS